MSLKMFLLLICCIGWALAYVGCIQVGFKQKTYAMPVYALFLNITWESFNSFHGARIIGLFHVTTVFDIIGFLLDFLILITYLKFGKPERVTKIRFYNQAFLFLLLGYLYQFLFGYFFGLPLGGLYSSYVINLTMSILFVKMFYDRKGDVGQNLWIGILKAIGTLAATILVGFIGVNKLGGLFPKIGIIGLIIFLIDFYYCYLLYREKKKSRLIAKS